MNLNQNKKPNFLIVGAAKSGTTSLYAYLKKHQDIYLSETIKETFFLTGLHGNYVNSEGGNYNYG
ncbi:MAG: hypothetical protein K8F36_11940, partial [Melioribacteraceae bacterium]|nr:hypothetical protein [Melioribacteraceae bacterium]